jgi:hypothetical protein
VPEQGLLMYLILPFLGPNAEKSMIVCSFTANAIKAILESVAVIGNGILSVANQNATMVASTTPELLVSSPDGDSPDPTYHKTFYPDTIYNYSNPVVSKAMVRMANEYGSWGKIPPTEITYTMNVDGEQYLVISIPHHVANIMLRIVYIVPKEVFYNLVTSSQNYTVVFTAVLALALAITVAYCTYKKRFPPLSRKKKACCLALIPFFLK